PPYLLSRLISKDGALRDRYASGLGLLAAWMVGGAHAGMQALQQLGWSEGRKLRIDRWGRGNAADTRKYAGELVALCPTSSSRSDRFRARAERWHGDHGERRKFILRRYAR